MEIGKSLYYLVGQSINKSVRLSLKDSVRTSVRALVWSSVCDKVNLSTKLLFEMTTQIEHGNR